MPAAFAEAALLQVRAIFAELEQEHEREVTVLMDEIAQLRQDPSGRRTSAISDRGALQSDSPPRDRGDRAGRSDRLQVRRSSTTPAAAVSPVVGRTAASSACLSPLQWAVVTESDLLRPESSMPVVQPNDSTASSARSFAAPPEEGLVTGAESGSVTPNNETLDADAGQRGGARRWTGSRSASYTTVARNVSYTTLASRSTRGTRAVSKSRTSRQLPEVGHKMTMVVAPQAHVASDLSEERKEARWVAKKEEALESQGAHLRAVCLKVISNHTFDSFLGFVIILNSILIGVESLVVPSDKREDSVLNASAATAPYLIAENVFLVIYVVEICLRFFALRMEALASGWVKFDLVLVIIGVSGSWIFPLFSLLMSSTNGSLLMSAPMVLRVFRLARLARALRLFAQFRTLWMLVHGLISSVATILNVFLVLFLTLYVFSCIALELITNNDLANNNGEFEELVQLYWRNLPICMLTLVQCVSFDSIGGIYSPMIQDDPKLIFFFVPFLLIVSIVMMNLITAVIVEAFLDHATQDKELQKKERDQKVREMMPQLEEVFESLDEDASGMVTLEELMNAPQKSKEQLASLLDYHSLLELWEMLDKDGDGEVNVKEFCDGILALTLSKETISVLRMQRQIDYMREELELIGAALAPSQQTRGRRLSAVVGGQRAVLSGNSGAITVAAGNSRSTALEEPPALDVTPRAFAADMSHQGSEKSMVSSETEV